MNRAENLKAADKCVNGNREQDYGSPENNFNTIARMWKAYLSAKGYVAAVGCDLDSKDVAAMLALLKIARISSGHAKEDNWIDLAGYAACGGELESTKAKSPAAIGEPVYVSKLPPDPTVDVEYYEKARAER